MEKKKNSSVLCKFFGHKWYDSAIIGFEDHYGIIGHISIPIESKRIPVKYCIHCGEPNPDYKEP
jgi:hypothetical protein